MSKLNVSERFFSIQGEGQTMGVPAVFLRLGGCNLLCESKNWRCDTIEVWRKSKATPFEEILSNEYIDKLNKGAHLVITGGEPMVYENKIYEYLCWFMETYGFLPYVEMETNGTIEPSGLLSPYVYYWNVSPKLSSAGSQNTKSMRINESALKKLNELEDSIFKFVISCVEDVDEVLDDFGNLIDKRKIYLMPAGSTREELEKTRLMTVEMCKKYSVNYCDRLHVVIWNMKTGV